MNILNLTEIKDIVLIISGLGTFISALIALFTIFEIKKQRLSSYKPEIILDSFVSYLYADNFLSEDDNIQYKTKKYLENNQKPLNESDKAIFMYYLLQNIGFGTAKYIKGFWTFDYKKASKVLSKYMKDDFYIENDNEGFIIKKDDIDFWLFFRKSDLSKDTIDYILPESQGENGKGQAIPSIITKVYTYYLVYKYNLKVGINDEHIYEEFEDLPKPTLQIVYRDFNNKTHSSKFKLSFKYAGNSIEVENKDKNDCGLFYIDVNE
jgi:hypothetical protein